MAACSELVSALENGAYHSSLTSLYDLDGTGIGLDAAKLRIKVLLEEFCAEFGNKQVSLFSAPGRTEIGGNHTDHQNGCVLCGSVDLDMLACAAPNGTDLIHIRSKGYPDLEVRLDDLRPCAREINTSVALVRGVAAKITEFGYRVSGFDACITSDVLSGSGLSSSAAYEVLIGTILNHFFCAGELDAVQIAKIGQYAENVYFGKPCGLMDQMASSVGGVVSIDFTEPENPKVQKVNFDLTSAGYALCIVDTGSCHADLTGDYADITREMGAVADFFGERVLRDVSVNEFYKAIPVLRERCGDRAVLRAVHFFEDNVRAEEEAAALERGDLEGFLALVNASGHSSALHLQNTWSVSAPTQQAIPLAVAVGRKLLDGSGAIRVHGGGFAGTIQAFVRNEKLNAFQCGMERIFGAGTCHILQIRPQGGCVVIE